MTTPRIALGNNSSNEHANLRARYVYIGTYTAPTVAPGGARPSTAVGISVFKMNPRDGDLELVQVIAASNPSFLALNQSVTHLYSVNEDRSGSVSAYAIGPDGTLTFVNTASTDGQHPAHLNVHPSGQYLFAANYSSGNMPVFRLLADGSIGPMTDNFQGVGNGNGPNAARQEGPHAHQALTDLSGDHVIDVDLGADKLNVLTLDLASGALTPNTVPFANTTSGAGPRHMVFHPNGKRAYVLNELVSSVDVFSYDPARGAFMWLQTVAALPHDFTGPNIKAEIRIHPNGRFLYSTNRGHNSVTMYAIDEGTGKLSVIGWESAHGEWPRGMNIDPSGTFLYVANQNTDNIAVFRIQPDGNLRLSTIVRTPTPVDLVFGSTV